ncbi:MAG: metal-sensitive transcriptional regulator [Anaerolineae bacterium]|jgi:CsoR family transcriptional regulator, copper-sensing transcriptional repressor|nr:metal-sensitive transcriptional regulator [Anaerolineae bacterium]
MMKLPETAEKDILARLRRIEGQARGVQKMIAEERDCLEILNQLASLRSAAYSASVVLTEQYALQCMHDAEGNGSVDEAVRGLVSALLRSPR